MHHLFLKILLLFVFISCFLRFLGYDQYKQFSSFRQMDMPDRHAILDSTRYLWQSG